MPGGSVRLAPAEDSLIICEGIEDAIVLQQELNIPAWAVLSATNLSKVWIPDTVENLIIASDPDEVGKKGANEAAIVFNRRGLEVAIMTPPKAKDWNDLSLDEQAVQFMHELEVRT